MLIINHDWELEIKQTKMTQSITPGFGFPVRNSGSHSKLGGPGKDQSKAWAQAQASGFKGGHAIQLSGTLSLAAKFHPCRIYSEFQVPTNLKYF